MKKGKKFFECVIIFACLIFPQPCFPLDYDEMPDTATLSANRMRFDAVTGDFLADGDVRITAGELKVEAPVGSGNVDRQEIHFDEGIKASGKWQGDKIDLNSGNLSLTFFGIPTCNFREGVRGGIGSMRLEADGLILRGLGGVSETSNENDRETQFLILNAKKLEDTSRGLSFGAKNVEGTLMGGELYEMTAKKSVWLKGKPKSKGDAVSLKGDHALYSLERGSVVVSGHVVAVQGGRTLKSDSIVYFPEQNRVEALGGLTKEVDGVVSADRAEITIDLSREKRNRKTETKVEPEKKPQPEKKSDKKSEKKSAKTKSSTKNKNTRTKKATKK